MGVGRHHAVVARRGLTQAALRQAGEFLMGGMLENECE